MKSREYKKLKIRRIIKTVENVKKRQKQ